MTITELKQLVQHSRKRTAPENFSVESVDKAVADGFAELGGSVNQFLKNKYDIFEILIDEVEDVVPNRVIDAMGIFAEVRQVADGQKAMFKTTKGKVRARKFFTQVGLSGVYETFRLDKDTFELGAHAVGGACTVDFDRMIDGAETISAETIAAAAHSFNYEQVCDISRRVTRVYYRGGKQVGSVNYLLDR
jgi:hypothetical protein